MQKLKMIFHEQGSDLCRQPRIALLDPQLVELCSRYLEYPTAPVSCQQQL